VGQAGDSLPGAGLLGVAVLVGVLVGLGVGVVSADAMLAAPMPAPSTSIPEAIATAVLIEAATLLLPVVGSMCCRKG
ncbi:MAG TPA: hypothetical protein VJW23_17940, partial [Propionibacteriaceae bacterium]|nr:hypothetical protein [Propionibacteriaceae bacterium]